MHNETRAPLTYDASANRDPDGDTDGLMALPGVVGTAHGECAALPCIKVLVVQKAPELIRRIPSAIEGYAVEVIETGEIKTFER
ncbi:MAG: hypothetical protein IIC28_12270 [Chloroflexi bacterium]|nr:hypothetical protein [Chloroflexota bacterium]